LWPTATVTTNNDKQNNKHNRQPHTVTARSSIKNSTLPDTKLKKEWIADKVSTCRRSLSREASTTPEISNEENYDNEKKEEASLSSSRSQGLVCSFFRFVQSDIVFFRFFSDDSFFPRTHAYKAQEKTQHWILFSLRSRLFFSLFFSTGNHRSPPVL